MADQDPPPSEREKQSNTDPSSRNLVVYGVAALAILIIIGLLIKLAGLSTVPTPAVSNSRPLFDSIADRFNLDRNDVILSVIVLLGLTLTVVLTMVMGAVYKAMDLSDRTMPLALPEGSIRALLAFSLVLIFVCVSAFLFSAVESKQCKDCGTSLTGVRQSQLLDLQTNFTVAAGLAKDLNGKSLYEQIPDPDGKGASKDDLNHPLFNVIYYPRLNKDAADFAKQIFTTLASIFISVVSFYFGSSVTSSAVRAGSTAAQGGSDGDKLKSALKEQTNASVALQGAREELERANASQSGNLDELKQRVSVAEGDFKNKQAIVSFLQK